MLPHYWECPSCKRVSLVKSAASASSKPQDPDNPESLLLHEEKHKTGYFKEFFFFLWSYSIAFFFFSKRTMQAYIKDIIYGGNDGIVSVFGGGMFVKKGVLYNYILSYWYIVAAATGTGHATKPLSSLVLGIAKWFAGAVL